MFLFVNFTMSRGLLESVLFSKHHSILVEHIMWPQNSSQFCTWGPILPVLWGHTFSEFKEVRQLFSFKYKLEHIRHLLKWLVYVIG